MICPNCGRRNSPGATFCSRCRQRLPLASKLNGSHRRTVMVEPRGGGGSGAIVLGVALLAGFLFIGGAAAVYLSNPPGSGGDGTDISFASSTPSLPIFVQPTPTPTPTPSPTFILLPSDSPLESPSPPFTPLPTATDGLPTVAPSDAPRTPAPMKAKFTYSVRGFKVQFADQSKGNPTQWLWDFGDGVGTSTDQNPKYTYRDGVYKTYTIKLTVSGPGGTSTATKSVTFQAPPTPTPTPSTTPTPSEAPTATPSPTPSPTPTPTPPPSIEATAAVPTESASPASSESPTP